MTAETKREERRCGSEGCGATAYYEFVSGDVGTWYCYFCYAKVMALAEKHAAPVPALVEEAPLTPEELERAKAWQPSSCGCDRCAEIQRYMRGFVATISRLEGELAAHDERLTRARNALDAAGDPNVEPYPDEPVSDWERSLRTGGRVVPIHDGISRLASERDTARQQLATAQKSSNVIANKLHRVCLRHFSDEFPTDESEAIDRLDACATQLTEARQQLASATAEVERLKAREAEVQALLPDKLGTDNEDRIRALLSSDGGTGR